MAHRIKIFGFVSVKPPFPKPTNSLFIEAFKVYCPVVEGLVEGLVDVLGVTVLLANTVFIYSVADCPKKGLKLPYMVLPVVE